MEIKGQQLFKAFNAQLLWTVIILCLSALNFGLDNSVFAATQAMEPFVEKFGTFDPNHRKFLIEPWFLSLYNSLTYVVQVLGVLLGGWIQQKYGRRWSLYTMCFWALLSAILLTSCEQRAQLIVGRVVNYLYIGQSMATVPAMQSEICPNHIRGLVVSTYYVGDMIGAFVGAMICYGTADIKGANAYRIPFGIFFVTPVVIIIGVVFSPESPRWLIVKDRHADALAALTDYRKGSYTTSEILTEFQTQVDLVTQTHERGTFNELWKRTDLKRTLIAAGATGWAQLTGEAFVTKYGTVYLKGVGGVSPFVMQVVNTAIFIVMALVAMAVTDVVGRRPILLGTNFLQAASFLVMGGLGTAFASTRAIELGIVSMFTINYSMFSLGWGPIYHLITAEVATNRMRDMTMVFASVVNVTTQFAVSFTAPYLLYAPYADLGPRIGFIYGSLTVCSLVFVFFCIPECRRLSLEEIDWLFLQKTPIRTFNKHKHGRILPEGEIEDELEKPSNISSVEHKEYMY